jgi:putative transposase
VAVSHSHTCLLIDAVFATKARFAIIPAELFESLWAFTGGIARKNGMKALAIGGTSDHMHVLLSIAATMPVARALQLIKAGSSKCINEHIQGRFEWQEGYGAFTVAVAQRQVTAQYIRNQAERHQKRSFAEEYAVFLAKHGLQVGDNGSIVPAGLDETNS